MLEIVTNDHALADFLGANLSKEFGIAEEEITKLDIMTVEVGLGIKYGEDMAKTRVPMEILQNRLRVYEKTLRETCNNNLSVPYDKKLKKEIDAVANEPHFNRDNFFALFKPEEKKAHNVIGKQKRALERLLLDQPVRKINSSQQRNDVETYMSDEEEETPRDKEITMEDIDALLKSVRYGH